MKRLATLFAGLVLVCSASLAHAWHVSGQTFCNDTGLPLGGVTIQATSTDGAGFTGTSQTDPNGNYFISLPDVPGCYELTALLGAGESIVTPASGTFDFCASDGNSEFAQDFVVSSPSCANLGCWLTGGGAKFSNITGTLLGTSNTTKNSKLFNWGGNVNPGCSPTAGQGGQWNTIDNLNKLHFHGTAIQVVRCGNVDGIPPGSTSPATPFNFIEFTGTGRVDGIQGNKASYPLVYFFGRAEDRNEPGSNGQRDGAGKDRYFLNVYTDPGDPVGTSIMLVDMDGDPSTVDPLVITDGNMQIHVSSCDTPALVATAPTSLMAPQTESLAQPTVASFAIPRPNPAGDHTFFNFALPRDANVSLAVYDVSGRLVRQLHEGTAFAGVHGVTWDLRDRSGARVARGMYFARLRIGEQVFTQHLIVTP